MWCQKWCLQRLFRLLICKHEAIKDAKKENTQFKIKPRWERAEDGREERDVARLQMMLEPGRAGLLSPRHVGRSQACCLGSEDSELSLTAPEESQRTHNVNISKASVQSQRQDKEGRRGNFQVFTWVRQFFATLDLYCIHLTTLVFTYFAGKDFTHTKQD